MISRISRLLVWLAALAWLSQALLVFFGTLYFLGTLQFGITEFNYPLIISSTLMRFIGYFGVWSCLIKYRQPRNKIWAIAYAVLFIVGLLDPLSHPFNSPYYSPGTFQVSVSLATLALLSAAYILSRQKVTPK